MKTQKFLTLIILLHFGLNICAHQSDSNTVETSEIPDSVTLNDRYLSALDSLRQAYVDWRYEGGDTLSNPYLFQLLGSPTYYATAVNAGFTGQATPEGKLSSSVETRMASINNLLNQIYATQPWLISTQLLPESNKESSKRKTPVASKTKETVVSSSAAPKVEKNSEPQTFLGDMDAFHIKVKRPNFWKVFGNFNVQLQQTYISENWYKGGQNNYAANGQFTLEANYNNKKKLAWDNKFEARLGFQTAEEYNVLTFRPTNDLLRLTSKLGIQAQKHWFYTLAFQTWTQMMPTRNYKNDGSYTIKSEWLSPVEGVLSLGMDYKLQKKRFKTTVNLAPLALNYKHVSRSLDKDGTPNFPQKFGIDKGHNQWKFGSTMTATGSWAICKQITWDGRLYFFTDYKQHGVKSLDDANKVFGATVEFENTFTLKINKYLSTRLFFYPRFETMTPKMKKTDKDGNHVGYHSFFQFKEFLSFGLDVSF